MLNVTKYRLYPSAEVERKLSHSLQLCSFVRNTFVDGNSHEVRWLPLLKKEFPELYDVHSNVLQNIVFQLRDDKKTRAALTKKGMKTGKARLKPCKNMVFEATGFRLDTSRGVLWLSKIGEMKIELSRDMLGTIKQIVVKRQKKGTWFASIITDDGEPAPDKVPTGGSAVGIDRNLVNFCTDSDGLEVAIQKNYRKMEPRIKRAQRCMSRREKYSNNWYKARREVARLYGNAFDRRKDFQHKLSRYYVDNYDLIALEDLRINNMVRRFCSKAIMDTAWGQFKDFVKYKAERAGKHIVLVNPAYTSQECSSCGEKNAELTLTERTFRCPSCGAKLPRDFNAALNILNRALEKVGWGTAEPAIVDRHMLAEFGTYTFWECVPGLQVLGHESRTPWMHAGFPVAQVQESHAL